MVNSTRRRDCRLCFVVTCFVVLCLVVKCAVFLPRLESIVHAQDEVAKPKRLLLVGQGPDGHPAATHEYMAGMRILAKCLENVPNLEIKVVRADGAWPEGPELILESDAVVLFVSEGAKWIHGDPRRLEALAQLAARGGGLVTLHWGMGTKEARHIDGFVKLFGGCHGGPDRKYKHLETTVAVAEPDHPIVQGIDTLTIREEFYYQLKFVDAQQSLKPLLKAHIDGSDETVAWAWQRPDSGRSFGFTGLHYHQNWREPAYRRLVSQAALWVLKLDSPANGLSLDLPDDAYQLKAEPAE